MAELTEKVQKDCKDVLDKMVAEDKVSCRNCHILANFPELTREQSSQVVNDWEKAKTL